jgi:hypothetical protein
MRVKENFIMKRVNKIFKPLIGILAVVPFSLIGILIVGTVSKPGLKEAMSGEEPHHEVNNAVPSANMIIEGRSVVIKRSAPKISRLSQSECLDVGKPCETLSGRWVGVWGETVFRRNPS